MSFNPPSRALLRTLMLCCLVSLSASPAFCQNSSGATALHNRDVLDLLHDGFSPEIVIAKIRSTDSAFDTSPEALKDLKAANVPETVILAMVEASSPRAAHAPEAEPPSTDEFGHLKVYRQRRIVGSAVDATILADKIKVAHIYNGRRCSIRLSPGKHEIHSDDKSSLITLDVQRGKEYYVRIDEVPGFWRGHGKLTLVPLEQGSGEYQLERPVGDEQQLAKDMLEADPGTNNPKKEESQKKINLF